MQTIQGHEAFGKPGIEPRWAHSNKVGAGTAYSSSSHLWFTVWDGIVTEVFFPTVDRPQMRDMGFLISDGAMFLHEEKRDLILTTERISDHALGYTCVNADPAGRYTITKQIVCDPHQACLLQHVVLTGKEEEFLSNLKLYALAAPHLEIGGAGNNGYIAIVNGRQILMAQKGDTWLAMGATVPFVKLSCGFVGHSDGWTDLHQNFQMDYQFERATDGNIALTGELDLSNTREFTLGIAFGNSEHRALSTLLQSLGQPFEAHLKRYIKQWDLAAAHQRSLKSASFDKGNLYNSSFSLLLAHEDKSFAGAIIASLATPWGEAKGDKDSGGYHLVWTRDMVNAATALLAAGDTATPLRALIFLAVSQHEDGGFAQNFWVNGEAYWSGVQLDETAFPMMLAWRLHCENALVDFDPLYLLSKGATYLIRNGPVTQEERWEEASGYSPSTVAACITALIGAASYMRLRGRDEAAKFVEAHADYLEEHIEEWLVTNAGSLLEGVSSYYMRILPEQVGQEHPAEDKESRVLHIANLAPDQQSDFPARDVVDGGFLELVRYGIRRADDPLIVNTLKVIDATIKTDTPMGPTWHRYNHDGYGQQGDGSPFTEHGQGRVWPLLTGERGHYELAAGRDATPYLRTMEALASKTGLIPEQSWDEADLPEAYMFCGKPTGSAMPLVWAHAEYIKLLRSVSDGEVYDRMPEIVARYGGERGGRVKLAIWKASRKIRFMRSDQTLRLHADSPFRVHWSADNWATTRDTESILSPLEISYADLDSFQAQTGACVAFTLFWPQESRWEGTNYSITVT